MRMMIMKERDQRDDERYDEDAPSVAEELVNEMEEIGRCAAVTSEDVD